MDPFMDPSSSYRSLLLLLSSINHLGKALTPTRAGGGGEGCKEGVAGRQAHVWKGYGSGHREVRGLHVALPCRACFAARCLTMRFFSCLFPVFVAQDEGPKRGAVDDREVGSTPWRVAVGN
eukprot:3941065-Rhodomonas_salina.3